MTSKPTKELSPKLRKTIEKLQARIKTSPDYEVHQELKAIANRYLRVQDYESAVQLLYLGGELLLENGLGASGADITISLIDVYKTAHMKPDSANRARIVQLLGMIDPSEPNRSRIIQDAVEWSAEEGDIPFGDPELHHSIGVILANDDDVYAAEKHLLLGTKSSPAVLAKLLYEYFLEDSPHTAGMYISRAILPYLCLQNIRDAHTSLQIFVGLLTSGSNIPPHSTIEGVEIFPSLPLMNFLSLLICACQRGAPEFFNGLKKQYAHSLEEVPWNEALAKIGEVWFDIKIPRAQGNMMTDLLGSLFNAGS